MNEFISDANGRCDQILSLFLKISRNQTSELIKNLNVSVNDKLISKPSLKINTGDYISFILPKSKKEEQYTKANFDVEILYEDEDILVLNKPANITVHRAPSVKEPTIVDWLGSKNYTLSTLNGDIRPGIVHRLDKGTSGALVVAKNNISHASLSAQLSDKSMGRIYLALLDLPLKENILIDRPIGRSKINRIKNVVTKDGRKAKSAFINIFTDDNIHLISAKLFTGRTHQIRVHLASINRHILGDDLYGFKSCHARISRVMLHAYLLDLTHPRSGKKMNFKASLPLEFNTILDKFKENLNEKINPSILRNSFNDVDNWMCYN